MRKPCRRAFKQTRGLITRPRLSAPTMMYSSKTVVIVRQCEKRGFFHQQNDKQKKHHGRCCIADFCSTTLAYLVCRCKDKALFQLCVFCVSGFRHEIAATSSRVDGSFELLRCCCGVRQPPPARQRDSDPSLWSGRLSQLFPNFWN